VAVGDLVKFVTCKPISKTKKWKILKKVNPKKEEK
jgi:ribosomal protein S17